MNTTDLISILMPAYNCEAYIKVAIDSMLEQSHSNFELLIADDGSTDNTKQIIDGYSDHRIKTFHNTQNLGYLKSSNKLAALAKGSYITFQDADDWSHKNRLESLINEFKKDPDLNCAGSFVNKVDINGQVLQGIALKTTHQDILSDLPWNINCVGSSLMIRREVYDALGLYNEYFDRIGSEDLYWFGLVALNYKTINVPVFLYNYRSTPNSISNEKDRAPKKQMSGEFAKYFLQFYIKNKEEIFKKERDFNAIELFLLGKCYCWRHEFKKGLGLVLKSILINPFGLPERYSLLKMYSPKLVRK